MQPQTNPELELAFQYVSFTNTHVFLTGKAGTGKTTFLHRIKQDAVKRLAVVAPTGVAAINAGGMTIHSLFQLPFGPYLPGGQRAAGAQRKFTGEKIRLLQSLDLLVIDEISMVRADLLDGIDDVLRRYRNPAQPFGGVQLLMIGDLHQLPPVVKEDEWEMLRQHYQTPYFFSSRALQHAAPVVIELRHIYRQSDEAFIRLLNKVRDHQIDEAVLSVLNSRYIPDFQPGDEEGYITLSTHNATVQEINAEKLEASPGTLFRFKAKVDGNFPEHAYPADAVLEIKTGAQVMFVKNDPDREKRYYNGKIGRITRIADDAIQVVCPGEDQAIVVQATEWQHVKYTLDEKTREVREEVLGTFTQFPLKLAWAITIHKSQGLTFERVILDAQAAFAHGQVYVALSRCKYFEGLVLRTPIIPSSIRTDATVRDFSADAARKAPDEAHLERSKVVYQQALILELFGFEAVRKQMARLQRILLENEGSLHPDALQQFRQLDQLLARDILPVSDKFTWQVKELFQQNMLPEQNGALQERLRKASAWFAEQVGATLLPILSDIRIITDNKDLRHSALEALEQLQQECFVKHACFTTVQGGFAAQEYLRTRFNAALDFKSEKKRQKAAAVAFDGPQDLAHPKLFDLLKKWRADTAADLGVEPFYLFSTKILTDIAGLLPTTPRGLQSIKGIGRMKAQQFGPAICALVQQYCTEHGIEPALMEMEEQGVKPDTKRKSYDLFRAGRTIDEIAAERGFVRSTIEGHLAHFIRSGELTIYDLMAEEDVRRIAAFFQEAPESLVAEVRAHFNDAYSYGQIRLVQAYLERSEG